MIIDVKFKENNQGFNADFGETYRVSDGGYERGYAAGAKSEYDAFWDAAQNYGAKELCLVKFWNGWNEDNFKPKYTIYADTDTFSNGTEKTTNNNRNRSIKATDLREEAIGAKIDWSLCINFNYIFRGAVNVTHLGIVDMTNAIYGWCLFAGATNLEYVEKVILPPTNDLEFKHMGFEQPMLTHIAFENEFLSYVKFHSSGRLTHQSLINILNALHDYANDSADSSGINKTCTLGATNLAKLTDDEKRIALDKGWSLT